MIHSAQDEESTADYAEFAAMLHDFVRFCAMKAWIIVSAVNTLSFRMFGLFIRFDMKSDAFLMSD